MNHFTWWLFGFVTGVGLGSFVTWTVMKIKHSREWQEIIDEMDAIAKRSDERKAGLVKTEEDSR